MSKSQSSELELTQSNSRMETLWKTKQLAGELSFSSQALEQCGQPGIPSSEGLSPVECELRVRNQLVHHAPCPRANGGLNNAGAQNHCQCPAAAAELPQSCPTLCDPRDGSPPGSPVPGILQARTLEWVAISFSNA